MFTAEKFMIWFDGWNLCCELWTRTPKSYGPKQEKIGLGPYSFGLFSKNRVVNRIMIILDWNLIIVDLDFGLEPKSLRIFQDLRISILKWFKIISFSTDDANVAEDDPVILNRTRRGGETEIPAHKIFSTLFEI